jgi:lysyl-tRNA synthetase class 2
VQPERSPVPAVESSAIARIGYREAARELDVTFITGRAYVYYDVPRHVYRAFLAAESKGTFFNEEIRDIYRYTERTCR